MFKKHQGYQRRILRKRAKTLGIATCKQLKKKAPTKLLDRQRKRHTTIFSQRVCGFGLAKCIRIHHDPIRTLFLGGKYEICITF
jgi:hypothetical protein